MTIRIEKSGPVWTVIHSRPDVRNAMDPQNAFALHEAFQDFNSDKTAAVAVFWGEGGAFCSGWDLKHASALTDEGSSANQSAGLADNNALMPRGAMGPSRLLLEKPVIAAISGPAVAGGMELALWCDFRVMEETSYMGVYCRRWGVPLIDGGTVRLPRLVGQGRAMELVLTGRKIPADECARIGLCEYVVPEGDARARAEEIAGQIACFPQACVRADRRSVAAQQGMAEQDALAWEWRNGAPIVAVEGIEGAARFAGGKGRGGDFSEI